MFKINRIQNDSNYEGVAIAKEDNPSLITVLGQIAEEEDGSWTAHPEREYSSMSGFVDDKAAVSCLIQFAYIAEMINDEAYSDLQNLLMEDDWYLVNGKKPRVDEMLNRCEAILVRLGWDKSSFKKNLQDLLEFEFSGANQGTVRVLFDDCSVVFAGGHISQHCIQKCREYTRLFDQVDF